jgi:hypothetical protein
MNDTPTAFDSVLDNESALPQGMNRSAILKRLFRQFGRWYPTACDKPA